MFIAWSYWRVGKFWLYVRQNNLPNLGIDSYADPGGGEPPPTPTSPVCDSAFSEHHGCWPCEHREHSECEASQPSQPSSGRSSPRWDDEDDEERHHHVLTQGLGTQHQLTRNSDHFEPILRRQPQIQFKSRTCKNR